MKRVYKYFLPLNDGDVVSIVMPDGAEILHFGEQNGGFMLWALVDPDKPVSPRKIRIAGTGHDIDESIERYIGTTMLHGGSLVFHAFEVFG